MDNNNFDINVLLKTLSNMDKDQLEKGLTQASKILNSPNADKIINEIKNKSNNN